MCWVGDKFIIEQFATEDLEVFKIAKNSNGKIESYFEHFIYEENCLYKQHINPKTFGFIRIINEGFHSYSNLCKLQVVDNYIQIRLGYSIIDGYSNYTAKIKLNCIIPKGTKYFINHSEEIVSEAIKIISIEKL